MFILEIGAKKQRRTNWLRGVHSTLIAWIHLSSLIFIKAWGKNWTVPTYFPSRWNKWTEAGDFDAKVSNYACLLLFIVLTLFLAWGRNWITSHFIIAQAFTYFASQYSAILEERQQSDEKKRNCRSKVFFHPVFRNRILLFPSWPKTTYLRPQQ